MPETSLVSTPDGRVLEVLDSGGEGLACVFHSGTPGGPAVYKRALDAAASAGLRAITYARPGYGESTPLPGRAVAQAAPDTATVLDNLGCDEFVTYGWSGGGPHALACAALLADRCKAAATIASIAPYDAEGLDFYADMGAKNIEEFDLALKGRQALEPFLQEAVSGMREVTAEEVVAAFVGLLTEVDRDALTGDVAEMLAANCRKALQHGVDGMLDDDLAFARPWGLELSDVRVPVTVWQGAQDLMVPFGHGQWLAANVVGAAARLLPEHGHISLVADHLPTILSELAAAAT